MHHVICPEKLTWTVFSSFEKLRRCRDFVVNLFTDQSVFRPVRSVTVGNP